MEHLDILNINPENKLVILRCDFNVPLKTNSQNKKEVSNDYRIQASLESIEYLIQKKARLVLLSHLGRPEGQARLEYSLEPVAKKLRELVKHKVDFASDCVGHQSLEKIKKLEVGEILLLENLRFHKEENQNDLDFAKKLAHQADIFVNDAFGVCHRSHASTVGIAKYIKTKAIGFLVKKELEALETLTNKPKSPFVAICGGAKISDKLTLLEKLLDTVDFILIGGAMAFSFWKASGYPVGKSLVEDKLLKMCQRLLEKKKDKIILPTDFICSKEFDPSQNILGELFLKNYNEIPSDAYGLDIGPKSILSFQNILRKAKTIFWNGPMGVFEKEATAKGTLKIGQILAQLSQEGAQSIVGGGDSVSALAQSNLLEKVSHVSTGGGASLEFLEKGTLVAIQALSS